MTFLKIGVFLLFFPLVFHCVLPHPTADGDQETLSPPMHQDSTHPESAEPPKIQRETITSKESSPTTKTRPDDPINESTPDEKRDIEKELTSLLEQAESQQSMEVLPGVMTIEKMESEGEARGSGAEGGQSLGQKVAAYLSTHVVRLRLPSDDGNIEEGRGRLKRLLIPFLLLLKLVAATLIPIFMSGIALVALKGMWDGSMAALVAGAVGLRELLVSSHWSAPPHPRVTVLRPHIPIDHVYHSPSYHAGDYGGFHHGWSRTGGAAAAGAAAAGGASAGGPIHPGTVADPYRGYGPNAPVGSVWDARL